GMTGTLDREEPLRGADTAGTATCRAGHGMGALLTTAAVACFAGRRSRHADGRLLAGERLLQGDGHVVAQIGPAAARLVAAAAARVAAARAKNHAKLSIKDAGEPGSREIEPAEAATIAVLECRMPIAIIGGALLIVLEDVVRLADFLEPVFRGFVTLIAIRMK